MSYYQDISNIKEKLKEYITEIFNKYNNELHLNLEDYNLLTNKYNCIETSSALGLILEEFISSKLEEYTNNKTGIDDFKVQKSNSNTTVNSSYDCQGSYKDIFVMINIKTQKKASNNNAVASINQLHNDYTKNKDQKKCFVITKIVFDFKESSKSGDRIIKIENLDIYCLEEFDFSKGHMQDHRNWSNNYNANSGRLLITNKWREEHKLRQEDISYSKTLFFIENMRKGEDK